MQRDLLGSAMRVVEYLSKTREPMGVRDLSRHLGVAVASTHRLLQSLKRERLVVQVGEQGMYASGERLVELATNLMHSHHLVPIATPFLQKVAARSGESVTLMVVDGYEAVCAASIESEHMLRVVFPVGWRGPLYRGASGRLLLAFQPPEVIEAVIAAGQRESGSQKLDDPATLLRSLAELRKAGNAVSHGERHEGWSSAAAAIRAPGGMVIGTIAVYGPSARFLNSKLANHTKQVIACARDISAALGKRLDAGAIGPRAAAESLTRRQHRINGAKREKPAKPTTAGMP